MIEQKEVHNVVLDIGNVMVEWNPTMLMQDLGWSTADQRTGLSKVVGHGPWLALDQGTMSLDQAVEQSAAVSGLSPQKVDDLYRAVPPALLPNEPLFELIALLAAAGRPLYVLSNMPEHTWLHLQDTYDIWKYFKGLVLSYEVKLIKPQPAIYTHLLNEYDLVAQHTLFLDDHPPNVEAAQNCGLQSVVVQDYALAADLLRQQLGTDQ